MQYDFSHFYHEKTVDIVSGETVLFQVTVQEIPSGKAAQIQNEALAFVDLEKVTATSKKGRRQQMNKLMAKVMKEGNNAELAIRETLLGVKSWTLKDASGIDVPVDFKAFMQLPKFITKQIEDAVEEINPEMEDDFQDISGDKSFA